MLVRATAQGYYGVALREPGQIFKLKPYVANQEVQVLDEKLGKQITKFVPREISAEEQFNEVWMERMESEAGGKSAKGKGKPKPVGMRPEPEDEEVVAARLAAADRMAEEAAEQDADSVI